MVQIGKRFNGKSYLKDTVNGIYEAVLPTQKADMDIIQRALLNKESTCQKSVFKRILKSL